MIDANGRQIGPIEAKELSKHGLTTETLVWRPGFNQWIPVSQVPELMTILDSARTITQVPKYHYAYNSYGYRQDPGPQFAANNQSSPPPHQQSQQGQCEFNPNYPNPQYGTIGFGKAVKICFSKYANFKGRAPRAEYWWFFLFSFILGCIPIVNFIAPLVLIIPSLAVTWRRLHDIGKGGGWYFLGFFPVFGIIILLVWYCTEGEKRSNRFGSNPYGINDDMPAKK